MVLGSQAPRAGASRKHMISSRRRSSLWPWVALLGVGGVLAGAYLWLGGDHGDAGQVAVSQGRPSPAATSVPVPAPRDPKAFAPVRVQSLPSPAAHPVQTPPVTVVPITPPPRIASGRTTAASDARFEKGMDLIAEGRLLEGRKVLSELLFEHAAMLSPADAMTVRDTLSSINKKLVFSSEVFPNDSLAESYVVKPGDLLIRIARPYKVPYSLLESINGIQANRLQVGQKIKVLKGPFHARVVKSDYRMDIFARGSDGKPIYITSYPVGLGELDSTPLGMWQVESGRKVKNPGWANPRTGQYFKPDDPRNPIGEFWIALKGTDEHTAKLRGYGIHGTTDPQSVGAQASMGCVRLRDADIQAVFSLLMEGQSTVEITR